MGGRLRFFSASEKTRTNVYCVTDNGGYLFTGLCRLKHCDKQKLAIYMIKVIALIRMTMHALYFDLSWVINMESASISAPIVQGSAYHCVQGI